MPLINIPYNFTNGTTADATQVDQNFNAIANLLNGGLDGANMKDGGVGTSEISAEAVTPGKTEGIPYAQDLFSNGFVMQGGLSVTKDGTNLNQIDVTAGVVYIKQADGTLRRFAPTATNFRVSTASNTYYLDLQPDGTWWWNTGHTQQANYINIATVTSDASSNVLTVTQNPNMYTVSLVGTAGSNIITNPLYRLGL